MEAPLPRAAMGPRALAGDSVRWYTGVVHTAETGLLQRPYFVEFLSLLRQLAEREEFSAGSSGNPGHSIGLGSVNERLAPKADLDIPDHPEQASSVPGRAGHQSHGQSRLLRSLDRKLCAFVADKAQRYQRHDA
jgi:hypothetical protein